MTLVICETRQLVLDAKSHVLVVGGPGAGKTTIALAKAHKRIGQGLEPGQGILFLSFSRAAVARVAEASQHQLAKAIRADLSIQTFHSFFWELLRGYGYLLGAPRHLRLLLPQDENATKHEFEAAGGDWLVERERLFAEQGLVAFDLFAPKLLAILRGSNRIRDLICSKFPLIVVDEAQDTGTDQWEIVRRLGEQSQLVCLADLDQQIYDFRPDVSAARVDEIMDALHPLRVDLEAQNHRSPNCEIVNFANDVLLATPRGKPYRGVSEVLFHPQRARRDRSIRQSVGLAYKQAREMTDRPIESLALIATRNRGVSILSKALTGDGDGELIAHRVLIDEAPVLLSSRVVAFLLEPRLGEDQELDDVAAGLRLCANVFRGKGGASNLDMARRLAAAAEEAAAGREPRRSSMGDRLRFVLSTVRAEAWSGDPRADWLTARRSLRENGATPMKEIAGYAEQLVAFQRGQRIARALADLWQSYGAYRNARIALDDAIATEQLLSGGDEVHGIQVMTAHKAKGKEFDAVVLFDDPNSSPLVYTREDAPYRRSRKLARVAISRARHHVLVLTCMMDSSELLSGHRL